MYKKRGIRQSTLNFILGGLSIAFSIALVVVSIQVTNSFAKTTQAEQRRAEFNQLGADMLDVTAYLTDELRSYVQFGNLVHHKNYLQEINETKTRERILQRVEEMGVTEDALRAIATVKAKSDALAVQEQSTMDVAQSGNLDKARRMLFHVEYESGRVAVIDALSEFEDIINTQAVEQMNQAQFVTNSLIVVMILLAVLMAVFSSISLLLSHFKIIRPIIKVKDAMMTVAGGDFSQSLDMKADNTEVGQLVYATTAVTQTNRDIIGEISSVLTQMSNGNLAVEHSDYPGDFAAIKTALNRIIVSFNQMLGNVRTASDQVAAGATQVADSSMALSQGATEQASAMEELASAFEDVSSHTQYNADFANQANHLAAIAKDGAVHGNAQMHDMVRTMEEIGESSSDISRIIRVIDDIAFQTNILALNAAVEAARAGQYGKGFAVVADEVRSLAARSASAAKETTDMIQDSIDKVAEGTQIAHETASALSQIVDSVEQVAVLVGNIAGASNEQALSIAQINQGMMQVSQVVQTNSATSEEGAAASEELSSQAALLKGEVEQYKLKNG